jgi:hypothetical protein
VALSGDAAELARDEDFVKGSYLGDGAVEANGNGAADLHFADADGSPCAADLLEAIEERAAQEGRNAADVLLDLLREAIDSPATQRSGNGGSS